MAQENWVQSQLKSYQRLKKWFPCLTLSIIRYGSRVKWINPGKGVVPFPTPWCSSYQKGRLGVGWPPLCGHNHFIFLSKLFDEIILYIWKTAIVILPCIKGLVHLKSNYQPVFLTFICPVGWDCRIHRRLLCRGVRLPSPTSVLDMTLNNLMVRFQYSWSFGECRVPLHCHCSQVHSGLEW